MLRFGAMSRSHSSCPRDTQRDDVERVAGPSRVSGVTCSCVDTMTLYSGCARTTSCAHTISRSSNAYGSESMRNFAPASSKVEKFAELSVGAIESPYHSSSSYREGPK